MSASPPVSGTGLSNKARHGKLPLNLPLKNHEDFFPFNRLRA